MTAAGRADYNERRPHSALDMMAPANQPTTHAGVDR
jgi:transposase InsO family protein